VKIAILGGGLTGITLARLYYEKGNEVIILEKEAAYGGLCRSFTDQGFTFDIGGSHIIFSRDTEVLSFMHDVLGQNKGKRKRNTKIFHAGKYIKYPFENGLHELDLDECYFCLHEFIKNLIAVETGKVKGPANFREWMYCTFGKGISELYLVPYNEKIWKFPTEQMSCHWVEGRVPRPPVEDVIKSAIGMVTEGYTHQIQFIYPETGGIEALVRAIAGPIEPFIRNQFSISSLHRDGRGFIISDGKEEIVADKVISTIPVQALISCLQDVPAHISRAVGNLVYNSLYCVFFGVKGKVPPYSWVYVPDKETGLFNRISFPSNYSNRVAPEGHSSVLVEITFHEGDDVDCLKTEEVLERAFTSLQKMGIISRRKDVVYSHVERQKYAYVIYDLAYQKNNSSVQGFCRSRDIGLVGRFAQFEYLNMDGCIRSAIDYVREHPCG
jgi:protoporphyrinogen oxidase